MKSKRLWMNILIAMAWVVSLGGLVTLMSFIEVKKAEVVCKDVKVIIPGNEYFIDKQEVDDILHLSSHTLIGRRMEHINIHDIEDRLKANPFIESAKVYTDMDGVIRVVITQRKPMMRVVNLNGQDFYIDEHGLKIPLSNNFTANVIVANGFIDEPFGQKVDTLTTQLAKALYTTADFIRRDSLWSAQVAQLYVNRDHDIELIPRVGDQRILIGNADSLQVKFRNLLAFYKQALPTVGWDKYKVINIKYLNQVVGVRNENAKTDTAKVKKPDTLTTSKDTSQIKH